MICRMIAPPPDFYWPAESEVNPLNQAPRPSPGILPLPYAPISLRARPPVSDLLALSALLARGLSVDPRAIGTNGKPSLRNQKKGSIYLYIYKAEATPAERDGLHANSANSANRSASALF
jgi:hypothetical protein